MAQRNFARGEPPPPDSWEWAGVAKPPERKKTATAPGGKPAVAFVEVTTVTVEKKSKMPWLLVGIGGVIGFFLGRSSNRSSY